VGHYESFFTASAGASAAILGLLVVAVSVVNADDKNPTTRELRTVLAGSAFVVLTDIFFVSIVALTGGSVVLALASLTMGAVGLLATKELIPRAKRAGNFAGLGSSPG
jgi:F0F1-type ATP synthase assembly protein I